MPRRNKVPRMKKLSLIVMSLSHMFIDIYNNVLPVLLPLFVLQFSLSYTQVGLVVALFSISSSLVQPIFGFISDRWRTNWFLPGGILGVSILASLLGLAPNYSFLLVAVGLMGISSAIFHPRGLTSASLASGQRRGLGVSIFSLGGNIGFALGPIVAAFVVLHWGLRGTVFLLIPGIIIAALTFYLRRHFYLVPQREPRAEKEHPFSQLPLSEFLVLCSLVTLRAWAVQGIVAFLPLYLQSREISLNMAGNLLSAFLFSGAVAGLLGGYLSDILGRKAVMSSSLFLFTPLMFLFLQSTGKLSMVFLILAGTMLLTSAPLSFVMAHEMMPNNIGLASGLIMGLAFGTGGLGVGVAGMIADRLGLGFSMTILSLLPLLAGFMTFLLKERRATLANVTHKSE